MTRRRWIADELSDRDHAVLTGEHADHLIRVLRARVGQEFDIATGTNVRRGRIVEIGQSRIQFELGEEVDAASIPHITLVLSIVKFDRMEWALEKCTELGVAKIIPLISRRTDAHLVAASNKRLERWCKIAFQAAEQSRRPAPPEIAAPTKMQDAAKIHGGIRIVLNEAEQQQTLRQLLAKRPGDDAIVLAIGPEGGWTEDELQIFENQGWLSASLGPTILRSETAAIAATAVTIAE